MEILSSPLRGDLNLRAGISSELGALARRGHLEFSNGIHADAIGELLIYSRVRHRLAVDSEIVLIGALSIKGSGARYGIGWSAGNRLQKSREIASV